MNEDEAFSEGLKRGNNRVRYANLQYKRAVDARRVEQQLDKYLSEKEVRRKRERV